MKRCPNCNFALEAPKLTPAVIVAGLRLMQQSHSPLWHWPDPELKRLEKFLKPGDELAAIYAYSVRIMRATGEVESFERQDNVVESAEASAGRLTRNIRSVKV
jgi:hypothetical protein